jgi:hypothetical protein
MNRREKGRDFISMWKDFGAYLRGEDKEGVYLIAERR